MIDLSKERLDKAHGYFSEHEEIAYAQEAVVALDFLIERQKGCPECTQDGKLISWYKLTKEMQESDFCKHCGKELL